MRVIKRDGREEEWNNEKLREAINKASIEAEDNIDNLEQILHKIESKFKDWPVVDVTEVHSAVENTLMASKYKNTARKYIEKRSERDREREAGGKLFTDLNGFLNQTSEEFIRENANKAATVVSTHRDLLAGIFSKHVALTQVMPKDVAAEHKRGSIHCHDTDYYLSPAMGNCCLVNYIDMFENGFKLGDAEIEKPKSIGTACTILTQVAQGVAGSMYGGTSFPMLDSGLKQYAEASYNKLKEKQSRYALSNEWLEDEIRSEVHNAMQSLLYQVNTLTTTNGQVAFLSISMGLDTSKFGRMITEEYLKVHMNGLGKNHTTPTFPKVLFMLEEGTNMNVDDPNYDLKKLAIQCSSKHYYPDYISVPKNKEITGSSSPVTPMSCRSFLSKWEDDTGHEKLLGRFNLGVTSINVPFVAFEATRDGINFFENLDHYCELAYKSDMARIERMKKVKAKQNPLMFCYGALARLDPEDTIEQLIIGGYASASIGYVGVAEAVEHLMGEYDNKEFAIKIVKFLAEKCLEFKKRSNIGFSLYATPAESLCYKAALSVRKEFGVDSLKNDFVTNSFHLPVWLEASPWEKWGYEHGFAEISSGGNISYVEMPNLSKNLEAYEGLIDYAFKTGMHYYAINTPVDRCFKCKYEGEFIATEDGYKCPCCGNDEPGTLSVLRRVSGYISAPNSRPFGRGKQHEVMQRVKHK